MILKLILSPKIGTFKKIEEDRRRIRQNKIEEDRRIYKIDEDIDSGRRRQKKIEEG